MSTAAAAGVRGAWEALQEATDPTAGADPYQALGVDRSASDAEVRRAFHAVALRCHPDKLEGLPPPERARAEAAFSVAREAYEQLRDRG